MAIRKPITKLNRYEYNGPRLNGKYVFGGLLKKANSIQSNSELGPIPSEVAAAMVDRKYPLEEDWSSVLDGWCLNESIEGLKSKLERFVKAGDGLVRKRCCY
ncbi:hypothetical protein ACH5RR_032875 [Cinchona calisaya]|uniref:Uncharacterized protein n=1 Tax=Cinchona calisaya TaxID=153742 RepID=A0ABD2YJD0_9GENT